MKWGNEWGLQLFLRTFFLIENFLWNEAKSEVYNYF